MTTETVADNSVGSGDDGDKTVAVGERKTLFVKNLPENATKEQLDLVFSEVGRLRHCFVVKKRRTDKFRGIGFVTFTDAPSVDAALRRSFKLGNCQLEVSIAEDKKKKDPAARPKPNISFTKEAKKARQLQKAKLIVRNLSFKATETDLEQNFCKYGKVVSVAIPRKEDGKARGFAFIQFGNVLDAAKAVQALNAKTILGRPVAVDFAVAKGKFEEVRNASKKGEESVKKSSRKSSKKDSKDSSDEKEYQENTRNEEQAIKKSSRKTQMANGTKQASHNGSDSYGQAEFSHDESSPENSGEGSYNGDKKLNDDSTATPKGKPIVKKKNDQEINEDDDEDENDDVDISHEAESESEVEFGSDGEVRLVKSDQVKDKSRTLKRTNPKRAAVTLSKNKKERIGKDTASSDNEEDSDNDDEDQMDVSKNSDDSDDEAEDDEFDETKAMEVDEDETNSDDTDKKEKPQEKTKEARVVKAEQRKLTHDKGSKGQDRAERQRHENEDDSDSDWGLALNDDSSENDDESTDEDREKAKRKREMIQKEDLRRTVFVRNIHFDTTQTTFQEHMKKFGPYKFCLICTDKVLQRSKGTGFVKFNERADADKCVESLQAGEVTLDGKVLTGSIAMKREELQQEIEKKANSKKQPKDKRNLYLAREGFIRGGTSTGAHVSDHDLKMRAKLEVNKKKALKNLHNFVSTTRLCIHNLPPSCDDKQLRKIFGRVVNKAAKITEARVMRNMKRLSNDGKAVSKGFGFVNFEKHEDALAALRAVNNNPNVFTDQMRPIVSFSIENRAALMVKERRLKRSQEKLREIHQMKRGGQDAAEGANVDYGKGKRLPFEGLRAQVDMKQLPKRVSEKIRLDPKRRQHQMRLKRLARLAKRKPEFRKKKEKKLRGPTKAQLKEQRAERNLNQIIESHRQKMRRQVITD